MPSAPVLFDPGPFELAEGPIWSGDSLLWVDINAGTVHRRRPGATERESVDLGQSVGCLFIDSAGNLLAALREGIARISFERGIEEWIDRSIAAEPDRRFNDGKADAQGRLWIGSMLDGMATGTGILHVLDPPAGLRTARTGLTIPNGIAWSVGGKRMHHIDSPRRIVETLDFEPRSGSVGGVVSSFRTPEHLGYPDGMCADSEGHLWIAHWGGGCVTRWDPQAGRMLDRIELPAANITACAFGGTALTDLFITTARDQNSGGAVYACRPGARGIAPARAS